MVQVVVVPVCACSFIEPELSSASATSTLPMLSAAVLRAVASKELMPARRMKNVGIASSDVADTDFAPSVELTVTDFR
ncbi:hypothetical protein GALL_509100 [mine drainage metagenome]|uniref:Uncharacterized protein n=1 Tax=mine drainage metagenome TaxID=410659 RepID=A0A1J5P8C9_9ZZZZ